MKNDDQPKRGRGGGGGGVPFSKWWEATSTDHKLVIVASCVVAGRAAQDLRVRTREMRARAPQDARRDDDCLLEEGRTLPPPPPPRGLAVNNRF